MKRIFLARSERSDDSIASAHFKVGSALSEFMAGKLGAPGCWPTESQRKIVFLRLPDDVSSILRWENEGGKTIAAPVKNPAPAIHDFHPTQPLLTQLI